MSLFNKIVRFAWFVARAHCLRTIILFVTNKCNARCATCFYWKEINRPIRELTVDEIKAISSRLGRFETLQISGGEPFMRNDIVELCKIFIATNKVNNVHIPTNGLLVNTIVSETEKIAQIDRKTKIVICCALDGLHARHDMIRGVQGNFENTVKTISLLKQLMVKNANLSVVVLTTLCKENFKEQKEIGRYVQEILGVPHMYDVVRKGSASDPSIEEVPMSPASGIPPEDEPTADNSLPFAVRLRVNIQREQRKIFSKCYRKARDGTKCALQCPAGNSVVVIDPDGNMRLCENRISVGNLREYQYDIRKVLTAEAARIMKREIISTQCTCDHSLFLSMRLTYNRWQLILPVIRGTVVTLFNIAGKKHDGNEKVTFT